MKKPVTIPSSSPEKTRKTILRGLLGLFLVFTLASCGPGSENAPGSQGPELPKVLTTTGMIADAAKAIGGGLVQVEALMGAGVDPHQYKASARDVERLSSASLILYSGIHLEAKMAEVFEKIRDRIPTVAVAEAIPEDRLITWQQGSRDPHVWFDVRLWLYAVDAVYQALVELLPDQGGVLKANHDAYVAALDKLDALVREETALIPADKRVLVTAHDAFEYFGRAYGFEVRGLQGISTVSEAGTQDVQNLADFIAARKIPAIFIESSVPRKNVEALQEAVKARGFDVKIGGQLYSDAMGDEGTVEGTYVGMLTKNIRVIGSALRGEE